MIDNYYNISSTQVLRILQCAKNKIIQGWTQHAFARDKSNLTKKYNDKSATCWCILGAIMSELKAPGEYTAVLNAFNDTPAGLSNFNDNSNTTKEHVIAKFETCIHQIKSV